MQWWTMEGALTLKCWIHHCYRLQVYIQHYHPASCWGPCRLNACILHCTTYWIPAKLLKYLEIYNSLMPSLVCNIENLGINGPGDEDMGIHLIIAIFFSEITWFFEIHQGASRLHHLCLKWTAPLSYWIVKVRHSWLVLEVSLNWRVHVHTTDHFNERIYSIDWVWA